MRRAAPCSQLRYICEQDNLWRPGLLHVSFGVQTGRTHIPRMHSPRKMDKTHSHMPRYDVRAPTRSQLFVYSAVVFLINCEIREAVGVMFYQKYKRNEQDEVLCTVFLWAKVTPVELYYNFKLCLFHIITEHFPQWICHFSQSSFFKEKGLKTYEPN